MFDLWVLWLNARNRIYIRKFNPQKSIRLANNKYKTKTFLAQRWIPVPETYAHLTTRDELFQFDLWSIPSRFVAKPNKGSKGKWITIVKDRKTVTPTTKNLSRRQAATHFFEEILYNHYPEFGYAYKVGSDYINDRDFKKRLVSFLDGQHTLNNKPDTILIEEVMKPWNGFEIFCQYWLADIRVVSFNLVPISAMIRVPTERSEGKANIAAWWIALGIDIISGKVTSLTVNNKRYDQKNFPDAYKHFAWFVVPYRKDILLLSSSVQYFINIGFIGIDRVITPQWPKLLEANGRAWLEIQNITQVPLRYRMRKVEDLDVKTPEKGVQISQSLFSLEKNSTDTDKYIYLSQAATIQSDDIKHETIATVSTNKKLSYMSPQVAKIIWQKKQYTLSLPHSDIIASISLRESSLLTGNKIELGTHFLWRYLIKPEHKSYVNISFINPDKIVKEELQDLKLFDAKIHVLDKQMSLSSRLKPTNLLAEMDTFIAKKWKYNPQFTYRFPSQKKLIQRQNELNQLKDDFKKAHFASPFAQLFKDKRDYLTIRRNLLSAYKKQDFDNIQKYNEQYFGTIDAQLLSLCKQKIQEDISWSEKDRWKRLSFTEIKQYIRSYLDNAWYTDIDIRVTSYSPSRIAVVYPSTSTPYIRIRNDISFREKELEGKLAHEIDIHLTRYNNGKKTWRSILSDGTAYYLSTEEWLAIHADAEVRKKYVPDFWNRHIYQKYLECHFSQTHSFRQTADYIQSISLKERWYNGLFRWVLRTKKWIENTSYKWWAYMKNIIYITKRDKEKSDILLWKITDTDLKYIL